MERWREKAIETLPELASRFEADDSPYDLWFELLEAFEKAYDKTPPDESLIRRIYRTSAPPLRSARTAAVQRVRTARCSGVTPLLSTAFGSAPAPMR